MSKNIDSGIPNPDRPPTPRELARNAIDYLTKNSLPTTSKKKQLNELVAASLSLVGRAKTWFDKKPLNTNEVIGSQEAEKGYANSPHSLEISLSPNLDWFTGLSHPELRDEIMQYKKYDQQQADALLSKLNKNINKEDQKFLSLEPIVTKLMSTIVQKYVGKPSAGLEITNNNGKRQILWGKETELTKDNAIRLVMPDREGKKYFFANLSYDQFIQLAENGMPLSGKAGDKKSPELFLFSKLLIDGIGSEEIDRLAKHNIEINELDRWYDKPACIGTLSAVDLPILDPRGGIRVEFTRKTDQKTRHQVPEKIKITAAHLPATAAPVLEWFSNDIMSLATVRNAEIKNKKSATTESIVVTPLVEPELNVVAPQLALDEAMIRELGFYHPNANRLAKLTNIDEIFVSRQLPDGLVSLIGNNSSIIKKINELDPNYKIKKSPTIAGYYGIGSIAFDGLSTMVAVQPKNNISQVNDLELAAFCNGATDNARDLINSMSGLLQKANKQGEITEVSELMSPTNQQRQRDVYSAFDEFMQEIARCQVGQGSVGVLAHLAGTLRSKLEGVSQVLASTPSSQLLALTQFSTLGKIPDNLAPKIENISFKSSNSLSVKYAVGIVGNEYTVRHKAFEDPVNTWRLLDKLNNRDLYVGMLRRFDVDDLDSNDLIAANWLLNKIKEVDLLSEAKSQEHQGGSSDRVTDHPMFAESIKSKIAAKLARNKQALLAEYELSSYLKLIDRQYQYPKVKYQQMPENIQIELSKRIKAVADTNRTNEEVVKKIYEFRIKTLNNDPQALMGPDDTYWQEEVYQKYIFPDKEYMDRLRVSIANMPETTFATTVKIKKNVLNYTNLENFIDAATSDAGLITSLRAVADRISDALTEHVDRSYTSDREKYLESIADTAVLEVAKRAITYQKNSVALALSNNAFLLNELIDKVYHLKGYDAIKSNDLSPTSNQRVLTKLAQSSIKDFDPSNSEHIAKFAEIAAMNNYDKKTVLNYLFNQNESSKNLQNWLNEILDPEQGLELLNKEVFAKTNVLTQQR